jgi:hypothetical protein
VLDLREALPPNLAGENLSREWCRKPPGSKILAEAGSKDGCCCPETSGGAWLKFSLAKLKGSGLAGVQNSTLGPAAPPNPATHPDRVRFTETKWSRPSGTPKLQGGGIPLLAGDDSGGRIEPAS